jgi:hypothetical protein
MYRNSSEKPYRRKGRGRDRSDRRMHNELLDDHKERRWYWILKEEAPDCSLWRTHFGRGYESVIRHD